MYLIPISPINVSFNFDCRQFGKLSSIGESVGMYWQKFSGFSPIGQSAEDILVNVRWTLANGESVICQIITYWRSSGNPL